jgi:hypothetical protein
MMTPFLQCDKISIVHIYNLTHFKRIYRLFRCVHLRIYHNDPGD